VPGVKLVNDSFFNEFSLVLERDARAIVRQLADRSILAGVSLGRLYPGEAALSNGLLVAVTETVTDEDIEALAAGLKEVLA
jgi:glycine dehydrogenase subunit 1